MTRYQLSIHVERLPHSFFHTPSPYAVARITGGPLEGTTIGKTEILKKTINPEWTKVLFFETDSSVYMPIKISIYDKHHGQKEPEFLGEASFEATEVFSAPGHLQAHIMSPRGKAKIYVSVLESNQGVQEGYMELQLRGLDIRNVEAGILGLGRSDPFVEIAKKNADHASGVVRWNVVHRSPQIVNHLNPFWDEFSLSLEELCNNDLNWPIRIVVKDWQPNGRHRVIGLFETTPKILMERVAVRGNADRLAAFEIFKEGNATGGSGKSQGLVVVVKGTVHETK
jgi:Ca2+-dependent lipid-binding protein